MWSNEQDKARFAIKEWFTDPKQQVFHLFGYAGVGKTTLAKAIAEDLGCSVIFAAFTGKAAHVLTKKGCPAQTIHSLIYRPKEKGKHRLIRMEFEAKQLRERFKVEELSPNDMNHLDLLEAEIKKEREALKEPFFVINEESEIIYADLVVIDECSMVDDKMGSDLLSFGIKILVLGDPFQLPPVASDTGYFIKDVTPNIMLTEIHRQAKDNPIIRLATQIREEQRKLSIGQYGNSKVIHKDDLNHDAYLEYDQILCGKNVTRHWLNKKCRNLLGYEDPYPIPGDIIVCLRNDHDLGILNGALYNVSSIQGILDHKVFMNIQPEDTEFVTEVTAHEHHFLGTADDLNWFEKKDAQEFDFGYALTVHKAQGSQYNRGLLIDESWCFRNDRWKWLYTGLTRMAEEVTVVLT